MEYPVLEVCKRTDKRYQEIRNRHYVPNKGTHGQQIHFLIWYDNKLAGIISGASSVYAVKVRDEFFNIPKDVDVKQKYYLPSIINNTVFRLEIHEKNLGTKVLSKFRKVSAQLWERIYGVPVIGFETFVVEEEHRKGSMYKADNWKFLGYTFGSTKVHSGLNNQHSRQDVDTKMIYCRYVGNSLIKPTVAYVSSWRNATPEEKTRAKSIESIRRKLIGQRW